MSKATPKRHQARSVSPPPLYPSASTFVDRPAGEDASGSGGGSGGNGGRNSYNERLAQHINSVPGEYRLPEWDRYRTTSSKTRSTTRRTGTPRQNTSGRGAGRVRGGTHRSTRSDRKLLLSLDADATDTEETEMTPTELEMKHFCKGQRQLTHEIWITTKLQREKRPRFAENVLILSLPARILFVSDGFESSSSSSSMPTSFTSSSLSLSSSSSSSSTLHPGNTKIKSTDEDDDATTLFSDTSTDDDDEGASGDRKTSKDRPRPSHPPHRSHDDEEQEEKGEEPSASIKALLASYTRIYQEDQAAKNLSGSMEDLVHSTELGMKRVQKEMIVFKPANIVAEATWFWWDHADSIIRESRSTAATTSKSVLLRKALDLQIVRFDRVPPSKELKCFGSPLTPYECRYIYPQIQSAIKAMEWPDRLVFLEHYNHVTGQLIATPWRMAIKAMTSAIWLVENNRYSFGNVERNLWVKMIRVQAKGFWKTYYPRRQMETSLVLTEAAEPLIEARDRVQLKHPHHHHLRSRAPTLSATSSTPSSKSPSYIPARAYAEDASMRIDLENEHQHEPSDENDISEDDDDDDENDDGDSKTKTVSEKKIKNKTRSSAAPMFKYPDQDDSDDDNDEKDKTLQDDGVFRGFLAPPRPLRSSSSSTSSTSSWSSSSSSSSTSSASSSFGLVRTNDDIFRAVSPEAQEAAFQEAQQRWLLDQEKRRRTTGHVISPWEMPGSGKMLRLDRKTGGAPAAHSHASPDLSSSLSLSSSASLSLSLSSSVVSSFSSPKSLSLSSTLSSSSPASSTSSSSHLQGSSLSSLSSPAPSSISSLSSTSSPSTVSSSSSSSDIAPFSSRSTTDLDAMRNDFRSKFSSVSDRHPKMGSTSSSRIRFGPLSSTSKATTTASQLPFHLSAFSIAESPSTK